MNSIVPWFPKLGVDIIISTIPPVVYTYMESPWTSLSVGWNMAMALLWEVRSEGMQRARRVVSPWPSLEGQKQPLFPRASKRRVLPIVGVCKTSSHLHIFTSPHLHIFSSSHLLILTSSHLHIFLSSHPHIFTSSHLHICSSSYLLILTSSHLHISSSSHFLISTSSHLHIFTSSHLLIFTSSHLHICSSSHLLIFTSAHLHMHLLIFTSSHPHICSSPHPHIFTSSPLALLPSPSFLFLLKVRGSANKTARNATLSHEMRFDRQTLR